MKELFEDIFDYHHHFNQLLITQVKLHESELPQRTFSMLCHILNASQIWYSRILGTPSPGVHQIHTFGGCRQMDDASYMDVLKILGHHDLSETIYYKNSAGKEFSNTTRDILFHAANHASHHKGQIISDFRFSGIDPLVTDYIFYKR